MARLQLGTLFQKSANANLPFRHKLQASRWHSLLVTFEVDRYLHVAAIVVAAGKSEMTGLNKLVLKWGSKFPIEHFLDALEQSVMNEIVVVVGHNPQEIWDS